MAGTVESMENVAGTQIGVLIPAFVDSLLPAMDCHLTLCCLSLASKENSKADALRGHSTGSMMQSRLAVQQVVCIGAKAQQGEQLVPSKRHTLWAARFSRAGCHSALYIGAKPMQHSRCTLCCPDLTT